MTRRYVHGYSPRESQRLNEQSEILEQILHADTSFSPKSRVLEAGCGIGAQSQILSSRFPDIQFTAIDISRNSLGQAKDRQLPNFTFYQADIYHLPFNDETFDHVFICFVLEHLNHPMGALAEVKRVLKSGGTLTAIEGDHGSCFWHPETEASVKVWRALITVQSGLAHDPNIGRRLHPLLTDAGFSVQFTRPCWLYADAGSPALLDGMVNKIIVPMVKTAKEQALSSGLIDMETWALGIQQLQASGNPPEGTFFYTWFKSLAFK